jgi:predicted transcriptional regulator YdeE
MKRSLLSLAALAVVLAATVILSDADRDLTPKIIEHLDGFTVIGISARTNNAKEASPDGVIGKQWQGLFQESLLDKIPNKADNIIIAAYTDYAGDHTGDYTFVLGAKVTSAKDVPAGMVAIKIPAGRYAMYTSEKGPVYKVVPDLWQRIWGVKKSAPGGDRTYQADFEVHDQRSMDPENSQVDVYVGVK